MSLKLQQQQLQHQQTRRRTGPTPFTACRSARRQVVSCSCSILPDQQLERALHPTWNSSSSSTSSSSSHAEQCPSTQPRSSSSSVSHTQQCPSTQPQTTASSQDQQGLLTVKRRDAVVVPVLGGVALQLAGLLQPQPSAASKLGAAADSAWEAMGGGPADLTFPDSWLGVWDVTSTLTAVELPMGSDMLPPPNKRAVQRAQQEDLNKPMRYQVAFMRNATGKVIYDRRFNTTALLASYYGSNVDFAGRINWDPQDPNSLKLTLPEGIIVTSRVLRRSEQQMGDDRFETSEFMQQVFDDGSIGRQPRVKASQCYTKFKWRDEAAAEAAGGPAIVATQVVNDFLTPFDDSATYMAAANKPITTYTYRMAFSRHHDVAQQVASVMHVS